MKTIQIDSTRDQIEIEGDSRIVIEDGTDTRLIFRPSSKCVVRARIGKNCRIDCLILPQENADTSDTQLDFDMENVVGEHSRLHIFGCWTTEGVASIKNALIGSGAEAHDTHILLQKGRERIKLSTYLEQAGKNTRGNVLVRAVLRDEALTNIGGMIHIGKNGAGAESLLTQQAMLLGSGAKAIAKPELEIENNDVSSRHAASIAPLDEEKIFYLMSRGIEREEAHDLIVAGFLESTIERLPEGEFKEEASEFLSARTSYIL